MRLDKYLKVSRIIKRRPVAKEVADKGRIKVNGILAKSSTDLKINDEIEIRFGNKLLTVRVLEMKDSTKKEDATIVQLNNQYINDENTKKRYVEEENRKRNRFMGWILIVVMLLFILPTYNLVKSYQTLQERKEQVVSLQKSYDKLVVETDAEKLLADRLKDDSYVEKYARAKYYLSRSGETIYPLPNLLPK